ncbi:hypothetical protein, partial [Lysinibacillus xylanilyticus]|uniref:hypothetical protein n=1 Tax=Lysinibacillus xylanilyticus TaxID=582475 RepID=UPI003816FD3E
AEELNYTEDDVNSHAEELNYTEDDVNSHAEELNYTEDDVNSHAEELNYTEDDVNSHAEELNYTEDDVNSHAEEFNYTEDDVNYTVIQVDFDNIQSSEESLHNDLIQPLAGGYTTIEVDKPIKHQGFIGNKVLNDLELRQRNQMSFLDILEATLYLPTGAGVLSAIAKAMNNGPTELAKAAFGGKNAYVVTVYANGVAPSLSVITTIYYTNQSLRFVYTP